MDNRQAQGWGKRHFDWLGLLVSLAVGAVAVTYGLEAANSQTGLNHGYPAGPYFFLGSVALLSATGDVRMLLRHGICGTQRIARHLWRMCFALFIASASIFLARQQLFPAFLRKTGVTFSPGSALALCRSAVPEHFVHAANLHLLSSSPAANAGTNLGSSVVGLLDYAGNPRVNANGQINIGAYEK